jgi:16S rRNA (adenine1518-N6/adenine1519-N6)-dimethyltransferase
VEARPGETVIEIGAGPGSLTEEIAARASRVVAIELDDALAERLRERFAGTNVTVVHGDAMTLAPADVLAHAGARGPYAVAGNLPYAIAQPLIRRYLEADPKPRRLVVMVQAEVAESICARPGAMSLLSVSVQIYGEPRLLFRLPPSAFYPPPKVRSAIVRIDLSSTLRAPVEDVETFFRVARAGFAAPRKQLRNALAQGLRIEASVASELLAAAGIDPALRPQALDLAAWAALARAWRARGRPEGGA